MTKFAHGACVSSRARILFATALVALANVADAEDFCNGAADRMELAQHGWYWTWENDAVGVIKSDRYYTQGAQLGYTFKSDPNDPSLMARLASPLCKLVGFKANSDEGSTALGAGTLLFGQQLFTPRDTSSSEPIPDDRPYAGWIYLGARQELLQPLKSSTRSESPGHRRWRTHSLELQAGKTGRTAMGEETQAAAHDLEGSKHINGWDNQIDEHFGWQAYYNFSTRFYSFEMGDTAVGDMLFHAMGALGNLQQYAEAGVAFRLGRNMGPMAQRTVVPSALTATMAPHVPPEKINLDMKKCDTAWLLHPQECYAFFGVAGRGVAKNAFLEPATSGAGSEISPEEFVYEITWGARLRYKWVRFDYISTTRSREFEPAPANPLDGDGRHSFGSLTMSCYGHFGNNSGKLQWVCPGFVAAATAFLVVQSNK